MLFSGSKVPREMEYDFLVEVGDHLGTVVIFSSRPWVAVVKVFCILIVSVCVFACIGGPQVKTHCPVVPVLECGSICGAFTSY